MRVLLCLPPARTSNELDLFRALPGTELTVVSDRDVVAADRSISLPARRVPFLGGHEGWTAALAWLEGMSGLDPGPVDVVVSLELFSLGTAQASSLARRRRLPHVVIVAETLAENPLYRLPPWRQVTSRIARSARLFVCFSQRAHRHAVALGCPPERCTVVQPGVDTERFRPREEGRVADPVVLFVGMLRADRGADKGVVEVVEACERLAAEIDGLRLLLVGDGHLREQLAARAARQPFLEVLGRRPRGDVPALMRSARVLTLASKRTFKWEEQFGFVLVEAMACGLPVVASRSGAIHEVVPEWNPLVPEGDVDALVAGIRAALGPDGDGWGRRNRAAVTERFDVKRQGEVLAEALAPLARPTPR